ncbi:dde family endonuclease [Gigaspora margarita]|uniref:Dde family endonuclease n=1 Tax=Gigaspora margarita TaxID=4874 RepID=A0A8H4AZH4_GIGMA|nr:dde family endonuclease [Gigaspora margarita]
MDEASSVTIYKELAFLVNEALLVMLYEEISQLQKYLMKNGCTIIGFEYNEHQAVYEYLVLLEDGNEKEKVRSSYITPKPYTARKIRFLAKYYLHHRTFQFLYYGKYQKHKQLVDNEDIAMQCKC